MSAPCWERGCTDETHRPKVVKVTKVSLTRPTQYRYYRCLNCSGRHRATSMVRATGYCGIRYKVVRRYFRGGKRTIETGLTLARAQAHCSDPERSSSTATSSAARARTRRMGAWFDGYTREGR